jgi:hypothetical protein
MKIQNKKGLQLNQAFGAVLAVVIVAVLIIVALLLFTSLGTTTLATNTAGTSTNESKVVVGTGTALSASSLIDASCGTITAVYNASTHTLINSGNYTQTGCSIANTTSTYSVGASPTWRVSYPYTYSAPTASYNASQTTISNFSAYPGLVGLVGTIVFLALVIGVLVGSFALSKRSGV